MPISAAARAMAGAAALVFVLAGCGGQDETPTVASAGGSPAAVATGDAVTEYVEGVRKYTTCLRAEGVEVSDPDATGKYEFSGDPKVFKRDPKFQQAQVKCSSLLPSVPQGLEEKPTLTAEEIQARVQYAKCMRENGAADFPDPGADGSWPDSADGKPVWDQSAPAAAKAQAACASIIGAPSSTGAAQG
ncbi:hypothetical protein [Actinoplanes sp. NPDC051851]|uniref:hypothetical protein n=1 Tax=Actinoplanes sp. NPDC051851 TaxID=3154753 RepID=UPI003444DAF6